jgi:hypothetical protein
MVDIPRQANVIEIRKELMSKYGYTYNDANLVLLHTAEQHRLTGRDQEWKVPDAEGFITVRYHELSRFTIEDHREFPRKRVASRPDMEYNRSGKGLPARDRKGKGNTMPPARGEGLPLRRRHPLSQRTTAMAKSTSRGTSTRTCRRRWPTS